MKELKYYGIQRIQSGYNTFNCTMKELKCAANAATIADASSFNCTMKELKPMFAGRLPGQ